MFSHEEVIRRHYLMGLAFGLSECDAMQMTVKRYLVIDDA